MLYSKKSGCGIWRHLSTHSGTKHSRQTICKAWLARQGRVAMCRELIVFAEEGITIRRLLIPERFLCALSGQVTKNLSSGLSPSSTCSSLKMRPRPHSSEHLPDRLIYLP